MYPSLLVNVVPGYPVFGTSVLTHAGRPTMPAKNLYAMLFLLVIVLSTAPARAQGQCYYPSGSRAQDQSYCNLYVPTTSCCPIRWSCDTNLLCVLDDPSYANSTYEQGASLRGTCTNPEWDETYCGNFCLGTYCIISERFY